MLYKKHQNFPIEIPTFKGPLLNNSPFHPPCWAYSARSVDARLRPPDAPRASPSSSWRRGIIDDMITIGKSMDDISIVQ